MSRAGIERGMMGQVTAIGYRVLPDGARVVVPAAQRKERRPDLWRASARLCLADGRLVTVRYELIERNVISWRRRHRSTSPRVLSAPG